MKKLIYILFLCFGLTANSQNLILNGSFELNTESQCYHAMNTNSWNNTMLYSVAYGTQIALIKDSCVTCTFLPNYFLGGGAQDGHWHLNMHSEPIYIRKYILDSI